MRYEARLLPNDLGAITLRLLFRLGFVIPRQGARDDARNVAASCRPHSKLLLRRNHRHSHNTVNVSGASSLGKWRITAVDRCLAETSLRWQQGYELPTPAALRTAGAILIPQAAALAVRSNCGMGTAAASARGMQRVGNKCAWVRTNASITGLLHTAILRESCYRC